MKSRIIQELGRTEILLPSLISEGLAANDRAKVRMSALQATMQSARHPEKPQASLADECHALGIDAAAIESLIKNTRITADERITAPGLGDLGKSILADVATMVRAVEAGDASEGTAARQRLSAIEAEGSLGSLDEIAPAQIARLMAISQDGRDSLHRLVMDLHKALNRLAAGCAEEVVAGAHAYGLLPDDRPAIEAFMRGVESTRALKFDHPGLDTTAARSGSRLTIQNDIGATDAHAVVIAVEENMVTITYTDVHLARSKFFTGLFSAFAVKWSGLDHKKAEGLGDDGVFYLVTGQYEAERENLRNGFLEAIGAGLVFLIDWNKARKVLREWVSKSDAVGILDWAARHRVGHRAFLELGGSELVASAVHHATPTRIGFGERLDGALGREAAVDFLRTVLRVSTEALLEGQSVRVVRDRIEADLVRHLARVDSALLAIVIRQAGLAREIATAIAFHVADQQSGREADGAILAARARRIEEKADKIAIAARNEVARFEADSAIEQLVNHTEDAIDELEQAAFIASLMPGSLAPEVLASLAELCTATISSVEAAASGADAAAEVPEGQRVDADEALAAVGRLLECEHLADAAERALTTQVLRGEFALRTSLTVLELARALERATDRLAAFGHVLRRHVLADLSA